MSGLDSDLGFQLLPAAAVAAVAVVVVAAAVVVVVVVAVAVLVPAPPSRPHQAAALPHQPLPPSLPHRLRKNADEQRTPTRCSLGMSFDVREW